MGRSGQNAVRFLVAYRCRAVFRVSVRQVRIGRGGMVAVATFQVDDRPCGGSSDRFHVNRMVQLDRAGIARALKRGKLRVAVLKAPDAGCRPLCAACCFQIRMTFGARLIAGSVNVHAAAVLAMTSGAFECLRLIGVMDRAVVTGQASVVGGLCGKRAGLLHVAGGAFLFEDRVRLGHSPAGIDAVVTGKAVPCDPNERKQRQQKAEPEFRALQRRRPLEIVKVDALRELFCCACAWHVFLVAQRHHGMNGAEQNQCERERDMQ